MRTRDYKSIAKQVDNTAQQVIFNASDCYSDKVVAIHLGIVNVGAGTGHDLDRITNVLVLAGGVPIINCTLTQLRALIQRFSPSNEDPLATANSNYLTIPFNISDDEDFDRADRCQFPLGANMQIVLTLAVAGSTGSGRIMLGYTFTDQPGTHYPIFLSQQLGISAAAASSNAVGAFSFNEPGQIRAVVIPTTGLAQLRIVLNGDQIYNLPGPGSLAAATNLVQEAEAFFNGTAILDPMCVSTPAGRNGAQAKTFLEVTTASTWAGTANEAAIYAIRQAVIGLGGGSGG